MNMKNGNTYWSTWSPYFTEHRRFLMAYAFRMTGSLAEAEDLVQDTFVECANLNPRDIKNHKAWLTKVCSNKALDHLKSAYKQRETYPGTWLPDALPESFQPWSYELVDRSQESDLLLNESLTTSFLLLIERLSPEERAVYLLSEIFEYPFKEIAELLDKSEAACRKTAQRARQYIVSNRTRFQPALIDPTTVIAQFFSAVKTGDAQTLSELLAEESEFWSDGGGKVSAAAKVFRDRFQIARFFAGLGKTPTFSSEDFKLEFHAINARPGAVISKRADSGEWIFDSLISFEISGEKITRIYAQRNPDKLKTLMKPRF